MNRPRNRQPRQHQNDPQNHQPHNHNHNHNRSRPNFPSKPSKQGHPVPDMSQVLPNAQVSIILKADQPTGREVQGSVQDILTRGNHPRGIKVRLKDGRVGRVQSMVGSGGGDREVGGVMGGAGCEGGGERWPTSVPTSSVCGAGFGHRPWEMKGGGGGGGVGGGMPPARSLADFIPDAAPRDPPLPARPAPEKVTFASATISCPLCEHFEGDEAAVSYHVETAHLD